MVKSHVDEEQFNRIMLNREFRLVMSRDGKGRQPADPDLLKRGWYAISDIDRQLWYRTYGPAGSPVLGNRASSVLRNGKAWFRLWSQVWHDPNFPGLDNALRNVLFRFGYLTPEELYPKVDDVVRLPGLGIQRIDLLENWLTANGYPSLWDGLSADSRRWLQIKISSYSAPRAS
jgi:hypothetical protein